MSTSNINDTRPTFISLLEQMRAICGEQHHQYCDLQELGRMLGVVPVNEPVPESLPFEETSLIPAFAEAATRLDTLAKMNRELQAAIRSAF